MACFVVPAAEAVITTIAAKVAKSKEKKSVTTDVQPGTAEKLTFSRKLKWLSNMLWGGSALLMFEHVWHGELVPWAPFLTAAGDPASTTVMLREIATTGVAMALLVTAVWGGMVAVSHVMEKREEAKSAENRGIGR